MDSLADSDSLHSDAVAGWFCTTSSSGVEGPSSLSFVIKDIAYGPKAFKEHRFAGIILEVLAKPHHEVVHGSG